MFVQHSLCLAKFEYYDTLPYSKLNFTELILSIYSTLLALCYTGEIITFFFYIINNSFEVVSSSSLLPLYFLVFCFYFTVCWEKKKTCLNTQKYKHTTPIYITGQTWTFMIAKIWCVKRCFLH